MKSFLILITILAYWLPSYAQVAYESIDIKVDNKYQYVSEYTSSSIKKYANAMKWLEANVNDFDNTVISTDAEACKVEQALVDVRGHGVSLLAECFHGVGGVGQ